MFKVKKQSGLQQPINQKRVKSKKQRSHRIKPGGKSKPKSLSPGSLATAAPPPVSKLPNLLYHSRRDDALRSCRSKTISLCTLPWNALSHKCAVMFNLNTSCFSLRKSSACSSASQGREAPDSWPLQRLSVGDRILHNVYVAVILLGFVFFTGPKSRQKHSVKKSKD